MNEYKGNNNRKKKYYPSKRNNNNPQRYHRKNNSPADPMLGFFNSTYGENMNFNGNKDVSAFVEKTVYMRDSNGNVSKMRQKFFLNSAKNIGSIHVNGNESNF